MGGKRELSLLSDSQLNISGQNQTLDMLLQSQSQVHSDTSISEGGFNRREKRTETFLNLTDMTVEEQK